MENKNKLRVLWSADDRDVFLHMIAMYTHNAVKQSWFEDVGIIIWGPSARLVSEDKEIQTYLLKMKEDGVKIEACRACADIYGVSNRLEGIGINVGYMGVPLTEYLKADDLVVMTF